MKVVSILKMSKMASDLLLSQNPKISSQWKQESEDVVKYAPTATCLPVFPVEWSSSGRASEEGGKLAERALGEPD